MNASFRTDRPAAVTSVMGPHAAPPPIGPDEALRAAHRLAAILSAGTDQADTATSFASSGLGALTIPRTHEGPGLSFETIAHVVRIVAEADHGAGEAIRHHLLFVAAIGFYGERVQQAELFSLVLRGFRFGRPVSGPGDMALRLVRQPGQLEVEGDLDPLGHATVVLPAHLLPIRVRDDRDRCWHAIADADAVSARRQDASAPLLVSRQRLLPHGTEAGSDGERPVEAIRLLLRAAVDAGLAGRAVADRISRLRDSSTATGRAAGWTAIETVGGLRLKLDAAIAMLEKAGRTVDRAVIRPTDSSVALAQVAASGARILATELAAQAGVPRPGVSALRSRRAGRLDPRRSRYAVLGDFYLNGVSPPSQHAPG